MHVRRRSGKEKTVIKYQSRFGGANSPFAGTDVRDMSPVTIQIARRTTCQHLVFQGIDFLPQKIDDFPDSWRKMRFKRHQRLYHGLQKKSSPTSFPGD